MDGWIDRYIYPGARSTSNQYNMIFANASMCLHSVIQMRLARWTRTLRRCRNALASHNWSEAPIVNAIPDFPFLEGSRAIVGSRQLQYNP